MGGRDIGRLSRTSRIAALISFMITLIILLNLLTCTIAEAITLPPHPGQCPQLSIDSTDKPCIEALQRLLNSVNIRPALKVNGHFDISTFNNVKKFQKSIGLNPDGIVGPDTADALALSRQRSLANSRKQAARASSTRAAAPSDSGIATTDGRSPILSLQDTIAIGILVILALVILLLGKRLRNVNILITRRISIFLGLAPTDKEIKLEALRLMTKAWEETRADAVADAYLQVMQFLLQEIQIAETIDQKPHFMRFRRPPKMIEGHVEKRD